MTNSLKKRIQSSFSIFNIFALTFQSFLPGFFMLFPAKTFAIEKQEVGKVDLEFTQEESTFDLAVVSDSDVEYTLEYVSQESDTKNGVKGVAKHSEGVATATEYAGTCSVDDCVPNKVDSGKLELPNANFATDFVVFEENLWFVSDKKAEVPTVELNTVYSAPQNNEVEVIFTKLPENPGSLIIEEITLTGEQVQQLGAYSATAYDISSDMADGTFEYELKLPLPEGADENAVLVYAESVSELAAAVAVEGEEIANGSVTAKGLDHFTIFIVVPDDIIDSSSLLFQGWRLTKQGNAQVTLVSMSDYPTIPANFGPHSIKMNRPGTSGTNRSYLGYYQVNKELNDIQEIKWNRYSVSGTDTYLNIFLRNGLQTATVVYNPAVVLNSWEEEVFNSSSTGIQIRINNSTQNISFADLMSTYGNWNIRNDSFCTASGLACLLPSNWVGIGGIVLVSGSSSPTAAQDHYYDGVTIDFTGEDAEYYDFVNEVPPSLTAPVNKGWNLRSESITAGERPVDVVCSESTNGDFTIYGNGQVAHNWETSDVVAGLKFQREWQWPGSGTWTTDTTAYSVTNTNFATFGSSQGTEGIWNTRVRSWLDQNGNNSFDMGIDLVSDWSNECSLTYDRTPPTVPVNPSHNAVIIGTNNFDFDWDDSVDSSTPITYEFQSSLNPTQVDGVLTTGLWQSGILPTSMIHSSGAPDGTWYWQVRARDAVGNVSDWSEIWSVTLDTVAPDVEVTTPAAGLVNGIVEVRGTVTDANPHHYWFVIQNSSGTTVAGPGTVNDTTSFTNKLLLNWDTTSLPSGEYTIKLEARDSANNKDSGSVDWVKVQVDNTRPTVTITSPTNDSAFNGPFSVLGTADDAESGVKDIRVRFRNESDNALVATFWATYDSGSKTWSLDINDGTNTVPEGNYRIVVHVRDNNGNSRNATRRRVHVDTTNPSSIITTFDLEDGGEVETAVFDGLIQGTATDEPTEIASGVTEVLLEIMHTPFGESEGSFWNGSDWQSTTATVSATGTTNWEYQIPEESVLEGTYTIKSHAVDAAGNVEATYTITIVYDRTIPEVSLTINPASPDAENGWYKTNPTVTLTANDNYSVDYIEYQWNSTAGAWTTYSSPINPPGEGQNVLYYRSVDTVGNVSDIGVKEVKYDATAPTEGPLNVRVENVGSTTADGKWQKPNGADYVHEYRLSWKHENGTEHSATVSSETYEHKLDNLFDGLWEFRVTAADAAGHTISAATKFRVGPEPSSDSGSVLGATTDEGTGTGGSFIGSQNSSNTENSQDSQESESNEEKDGSSQTDESGAVLGDTDNSCVTWKFYLPLFLLLIQVLFAVSLEIANREPNAKKLLFALAISGLLMGAFYMLRDASCFEGTGIMQSLAKWFVPVSVGLAFLLRGIGSMTVEEK